VPRWVGRCPECQAWGSIAAVGGPSVAALRLAPGPVTSAAVPIADVDAEAATARSTGVPELDRVLGGGLIPGAVVLLAGEPGVGKSTLLLEAAARFATPETPALLVTGEESAAQVRLRAARTGALAPALYLAAETDLAAVLAHVDAVQPGLLIVDSVQTLAAGDVDGAAGGITQVRAVAATLIALAKQRGLSTILVGHVTKDGGIAGPRLLEHVVDVVLQFEGERHSTLRLVRAVKNRYGATDEIGCFEMSDAGIRGLPDPSGLFLSRRPEPVAGTCVTVTLEGRRPLLAEVQALVAASPLAAPRRGTSGLDAARVAMVLAVLERRGRVPLASRDVYTATVGGVRLAEPGVDLAVALAVASAAADRALPPDLVAVGEVGLAGDLRPVASISRRLAEAARLGFTRALVPAGLAPESTSRSAASGGSARGPTTSGSALRIREVTDLGQALMALGSVR